jgi:hypothetical protein
MDNNITPTTFVAYEWYDLLSLFPEGFEDHARERMNNKGPSYGDAEATLIKGTRAERILYDAWDSWDGAEEHNRREVFARLPSLIDALVALDG